MYFFSLLGMLTTSTNVIVQSAINSDVYTTSALQQRRIKALYTCSLIVVYHSLLLFSLVSYFYGQNVCCKFTSEINDYYYYYIIIIIKCKQTIRN